MSQEIPLNPFLKAKEPPPVTSKEAFRRANEARDYTVYTWLMDAALEAKADSIFPYIKGGEGEVIVDAGSGTGALAELAARAFHGSHVYALDLSHELRAHAEERQTLMKLAYGDASEVIFPRGSVTTKYYSTSGHEVESFGGPGRMRQAMESTFQELKPGGRVVVRDFAKPEYRGPVYMKVASHVGKQEVPEDATPETIDYNELSTMALLERFRKEFGDGDAFSYEVVDVNGESYVRMDAEWAHEFYLRKDYTGNWRQEIKEKYTYWSPEEARQILENEGYVNVQAIPDPNEWILKNRLRGKVDLFRMDEGELVPMDFPATHMIIVGEKPLDATADAVGQELPAADYERLAQTVTVDEEAHIIAIDDRRFETLPVAPLVGQKKRVYFLNDPPDTLIKCVRPDARNLHAAFVSMYQAVERQEVLRELQVPHFRITEVDPKGPPYRYYLQERAAEKGRTAADLIAAGLLDERMIEQMAGIVNRVEGTRQWQLEMNPFSWRIVEGDTESSLVYTAGKVYRFDESWSFANIGLWQWIDPSFVAHAHQDVAAMPTVPQRAKLKSRWERGEGAVALWKKYLDPALWPTWEEETE